MTMTLVATSVVGAGGAASIDFTSIPQTGTDLLITWSGRNASSGAGVAKLYFNSDTTNSNYSMRYLEGTGSGASSSAASLPYVMLMTDNTKTANTFGNTSVYIPNYSITVAKSFSVDAVQENNATDLSMRLFAASWVGTGAITSIQITTLNGTDLFAEYSTASLYTITKGSGGATVS